MGNLTFILELFGTVAFAISGAITGIRKNMDILGVCVLGVVTAIGGGITRDVLLGALPPAVFGMLVVYCLKGLSFTAPAYGLPELIGVVTVVVLHLIFRKMLISIGVGTVVYMVLLNIVFV